MEQIKPKTLPLFLFAPVLLLLLLRPFLADFVYPASEPYYQAALIFLALVSFFTVKKPFEKNLYTVPLLIILAAYTLSTALAGEMKNAVFALARFISYLCLFGLVSRMDKRQKLLTIKSVVLTAVLIGLYSVYQYFIAYPWVLEQLKKAHSNIFNTSSYVRDILVGRRAVGTFPSPNMLGGYLVMAFFLSLDLLKNTGIRRRWFAAPVVLIIALVLTKSMGAWLSLILCLLFLIFTSSAFSKKREALFLVATVLLASLILVFTMINRSERLIDLNNTQNPLIQRFEYWETAVDVIIQKPLTGVGLGNFQQAAFPLKTRHEMADIKFAHNIFLHHFAETGLAGFIGWLLLAYAFLKKFALKSRYLFLAGLAFLLHNLIDFSYFLSQVGLFWWMILGLMEPSPEDSTDG